MVKKAAFKLSNPRARPSDPRDPGNVATATTPGITSPQGTTPARPARQDIRNVQQPAVKQRILDPQNNGERNAVRSVSDQIRNPGRRRGRRIPPNQQVTAAVRRSGCADRVSRERRSIRPEGRAEGEPQYQVRPARKAFGVGIDPPTASAKISAITSALAGLVARRPATENCAGGRKTDEGDHELGGILHWPGARS